MEVKQRFGIIKNFKVFLIISVILVSVGLVALVLLPFGINLFNFDIDFAGGTTMHFSINRDVLEDDISKITGLVEEISGLSGVIVQKTGEGNEVIIKSRDISTDIRAEVIEKMKSEFSITDDDVLEVSNVSPSVGKDLQRSAIIAATVACVLMLIYITIRFEFMSGLAAVICLAHDILAMLTFYVIFKIPMNLTFIAAALTILGYSINAGIIVFDRVRENSKRARREKFEDTVEKSLWQTMGRTVNTTITTLLTIVVIYILGVPSIKVFMLPIIVGVVCGAYSSIFLSGSLWVIFKKNLKKS